MDFEKGLVLPTRVPLALDELPEPPTTLSSQPTGPVSFPPVDGDPLGHSFLRPTRPPRPGPSTRLSTVPYPVSCVNELLVSRKPTVNF